MESRQDLVSIKEEPCDNWEDVANESVDLGVSVKTEYSDESSANPTSDCISSQQKKDEDILIECESVLVKHEPKPSLTTIYQAKNIKEENPANDLNSKRLTILNKKGSDCDNNSPFTIGEESSLTRQIETTNKDDGSHELEICKAENSDELSANESLANPTNDCISSQQKKDEDILIDCESVLVKLEPEPSLTTIYQATDVKEENPAKDFNRKKLIILIKKGFNYDSNRKFTREEATSTRQMETTHKGSRPLECEICHKSFRYPYMLEGHVNQVHEKNKPFQCDICHKSFGRRDSFQTHINITTIVMNNKAF
ncbi:myoneurin-like [Trichogramma pretiosum]|uniref:myoneurin-like n=1 Tax=Trichogramma pretiosum TaxID=7493 RepID=UPI000C719609|nr:myoneurin-like [Trichogramma pretiosum]